MASAGTKSAAGRYPAARDLIEELLDREAASAVAETLDVHRQRVYQIRHGGAVSLDLYVRLLEETGRTKAAAVAREIADRIRGRVQQPPGETPRCPAGERRGHDMP